MRKSLKKILSRIMVTFLAVGLIFSLVACTNKDSEQAEMKTEIETIPQIEYIDTDEYYKQNAEIVAEIKAEEAENVTTEGETAEILDDRGFGGYQITSMYNMDGEFLSDDVIDSESEEKHPMYSTYYLAESSEMWIISLVNGSITASPVEYNQNHSVETLIVEADTIMAYDGPLNKFYEIVPSDSLAILKKVDRIDSETLETLTAEEIDKL